MWIEFPSLLPISTLLLFLSRSEHSTRYSAEIIFCWMRFGHKSRADLWRALHSLFPGLLSTWRVRSLITPTQSPFALNSPDWEMSRWAAPAGTWSVWKMVLISGRRDLFAGTRGCPCCRGWSRSPSPQLFSTCPRLRKVTSLSSAPCPIIHFSLREEENSTGFCVTQVAVLFSRLVGCSRKGCCCLCLLSDSFFLMALPFGDLLPNIRHHISQSLKMTLESSGGGLYGCCEDYFFM